MNKEENHCFLPTNAFFPNRHSQLPGVRVGALLRGCLILCCWCRARMAILKVASVHCWPHEKLCEKGPRGQTGTLKALRNPKAKKQVTLSNPVCLKWISPSSPLLSSPAQSMLKSYKRIFHTLASAKARDAAKLLGFHSWGFPEDISSVGVSGPSKVGVGSRKRGGRGRALVSGTGWEKPS